MRAPPPGLAAIALAALACTAGPARRPPPDPLPGFPRVVLWAWERPENLAFIDPKTTGVAYWAGTIFLHGDDADFHPRLQGLTLPQGTARIAVVRIDSAHGPRPSLSASQRRAAAARLAEIAARPSIRALQVDF